MAESFELYFYKKNLLELTMNAIRSQNLLIEETDRLFGVAKLFDQYTSETYLYHRSIVLELLGAIFDEEIGLWKFNADTENEFKLSDFTIDDILSHGYRSYDNLADLLWNGVYFNDQEALEKLFNIY